MKPSVVFVNFFLMGNTPSRNFSLARPLYCRLRKRTRKFQKSLKKKKYAYIRFRAKNRKKMRFLQSLSTNASGSGISVGCLDNKVALNFALMRKIDPNDRKVKEIILRDVGNAKTLHRILRNYCQTF